MNKIGWTNSFLMTLIKLRTSDSFIFFFFIRLYIVYWSGDSFRKIWYYLFLGRYCSRTFAFLLSENSLIRHASSAVRLTASALSYILEFLAIPARIGFWNTFLKTAYDSKNKGFTIAMQVYNSSKLFWSGVPVNNILFLHLKVWIFLKNLLFLFFKRWPSSKIRSSHFLLSKSLYL